jgi:hypothetical protein
MGSLALPALRALRITQASLDQQLEARSDSARWVAALEDILDQAIRHLSASGFGPPALALFDFSGEEGLTARKTAAGAVMPAPHGKDLRSMSRSGTEKVCDAVAEAMLHLELLHMSDLARASTSAETRGHLLTGANQARIWGSFPYERVRAAIAAASEHVRILQSWIPDMQPFMACIAEAVGHGAAVEILILHPESAAASMRLKSLEIEEPEYPSYHARKLMRDLRRLESLSFDSGGIVRTCTAGPVAQLYGTEEHLWMGLFWPGQFSMQAPQMEVSVKESALGRELSRHFDELWASSPPLDVSKLKA